MTTLYYKLKKQTVPSGNKNACQRNASLIQSALPAESCLSSWPRPGALPGGDLLARAGWTAPWLGGEWRTLDCDGKIASRKAFFKKNHANSCRNIGNPENHQDS